MDAWRRRRCLGALSALVAGSALLAACGAQPSARPATVAQSANAAGPAPATRPTVKLGLAALVLSAAPEFLAEDDHFFAQQGLNVEAVDLGNASAATVALKTGQIQFLESSSGTVLLDRAHGVDEYAVADVTDAVTIDVTLGSAVVRRLGITAQTPVARRIQDLKGLTIGGTGATAAATLMFDYLLSSHHLVPGKDVKIVDLGTIAALIEATQHGQIDGFIGSPPGSLEAVQRGIGSIVLSGARGDMPELSNLPFTVLSTSQSYAAAHPGIVAKAARAVALADNFVRRHPDQAAAALQRRFAGIPLSLLQRSIKELDPAFAPNGSFSQAGWVRAIAAFRSVGLIKRSFSAAPGVLWTNQFTSG